MGDPGSLPDGRSPRGHCGKPTGQPASLARLHDCVRHFPLGGGDQDDHRMAPGGYLTSGDGGFADAAFHSGDCCIWSGRWCDFVLVGGRVRARDRPLLHLRPRIRYPRCHSLLIGYHVYSDECRCLRTIPQRIVGCSRSFADDPCGTRRVRFWGRPCRLRCPTPY